MPCNVDIATQEILKLSEAVDPNGVRTMGALTKPDLASEKATQGTIMDLVLGKHDNTSTMSDRFAAEKAFFTSPPWVTIRDRRGISALKANLRGLLMNISKQEFPTVKSEIEKHLSTYRANLEGMGLFRSNSTPQRVYLGRLASRFQAVTQSVLNGYYSSDSIFDTVPSLKLVTAKMGLNETFSEIFLKRGHKRQSSAVDEEAAVFSNISDETPRLELTECPDLRDIVSSDDYSCPKPLEGFIEEHIKDIFKSSRGPEIGTIR
ncbi:hypothetical protein F5Y08DRAFT_336709 [Xylaria arbuscula]|nr:hypothetical protein F5Y08DRAFT_336709 [Xylaria arbuscula]